MKHICRWKTPLAAGVLCCLSAALLLTGGCASNVVVPVETRVPGEFNLTGMSKFAIADFNSLPNDPSVGIGAADEETLRAVRNMVTAAFHDSGMYQVADLDMEKAIAAHQNIRLGSRFDAVIYGRVWWQMEPEFQGYYYHPFNLEEWRNVKYDTGMKNPITNAPIYNTSRLTMRRRTVAEKLHYRAANATLMLSLTIYRISRDGMLEKAVETSVAASRTFVIDNGSFQTQVNELAAPPETRASRLKAAAEKEAGKVDETKNRRRQRFLAELTNKTAPIPTAMQARLMLAEDLVRQLQTQLVPNRIKFPVSCRVWDDKLELLLEAGAWKGAGDYSRAMLRRKLPEKLAEEILAWPAWDMNHPAGEETAEAVEENQEYLNAIAVSCEMAGETDEALAIYRCLFHVVPDKNYALGISRCLFSLGMADRLRESTKALSEAEKKSSIQ